MLSRREAVIPARNESATVAQVVAETLRFVDRVIVIDDASTDDTAAQALEAGATVVKHQLPQGYLKTLARGLATTDAAVVVTLDADGEHDPADIPSLVAPIEMGHADLVIGTPGKPLRWSEGMLSRLANLRVPLQDTAFGYRAIRGDLAHMPLRGKCACGLLAIDAHRRGARLAQVPVQLRPVQKSRRRAWFHLIQVWWVMRGVLGL